MTVPDLTLMLAYIAHATAETLDQDRELALTWARDRIRAAQRALEDATADEGAIFKALARAHDRLTPPAPQEPPC